MCLLPAQTMLIKIIGMDFSTCLSKGTDIKLMMPYFVYTRFIILDLYSFNYNCT